MKRITFLLVATATALFVITIVATRNYAIEDKHAGHHQAKADGQKKSPKVDGSKDPYSIPDVDAQEMLFKILSASNPDDKLQEQRKRSYLRMAGFEGAEAAAITNAAHEYQRMISPLDAEVNQIKNQHWPNPDGNVKSQLIQKQKQKEDIMNISIVSPLKKQLNSYNQTGKFEKFILNEIKSKTKGFAVEMPSKKVSNLIDHTSNLFAVSAQAGGCDASVYIYSSTWADYYDGYVYCDNSYSAPYNNCGHSYTLSYTMNGSSWPSISLWGASLTGTIQTLTNLEGYCEQAAILFGNGIFAAGNNSSSTTLEDYVEIGMFNSHGSVINNQPGNEKVTTTVNFSATAGAAGKSFNINPGVSALTGITIDKITIEPSGQTAITVAGTTFEIKYSVPGTNDQGSFKPYVVCTTGNVTVLGSPKSATSGTTITAH